MSSGEVYVVPKNGQGHLFPCIQLCNHLISLNYQITLITDADLSSSIPFSLLRHPHFLISDVSSATPPPPPENTPPHHPPQLSQGLEQLLSDRVKPSDSGRPVFAILDHIMFRTQESFAKFGIPTVTFITSGACWAALQHALWKAQPDDMKPGDTRILPGLPANMVLKYSDLKQRRHWMGPVFRPGSGSGPPGSGNMPRGPPSPGQPAKWVSEVETSVAILVNTCDDLERPFIDYMSNLTGKPVWGVGPLLPDQYWESKEAVLSNQGIRPVRESNFTDKEVIQWLDSKPRGSVILVSFGSEVSPSEEEYPRLGDALEASTRPFIWVIQRKKGRPGDEKSYYPHGLDKKVGHRGMIIYGWAPQLLILSHGSMGVFVSHCGWNSTVEAIVRGVPFIGWPIRGDQYYNAKLLVEHLKVGIMISEGYPESVVTKEDILETIERLLNDDGIRERAAALCAKFQSGFPTTSKASLNAFNEHISQFKS